MSIRPPTDIILDVARAADPTQAAAAARKLAGDGSASVDALAFTDAIDDASRALPAAAAGLADARSKIGDARSQVSGMAKAHQDLEAFVLQNMVETMLPKDTGTLFGKGMSGSVFKSMMAEQIGHQLARAGGFGLSRVFQKGNAALSVGSSAPAIWAKKAQVG